MWWDEKMGACGLIELEFNHKIQYIESCRSQEELCEFSKHGSSDHPDDAQNGRNDG
jgi:hypothetical protein